MTPIQVIDFDIYGGHAHHRRHNSLLMAVYCMVAVILINIPVMTLIRNWPVDVSPVQAKSALESINLPKLEVPQPTIAPAVTPVDTSAVDNERLSRMINEYANSHPGRYGVTLINLDRPTNLVIHNGDQHMLTASTYKVFAAYNALSRVEQGIWTMSTPTGYGSLDYCLKRAIIYSDNNCGEAIGGKLGWRSMTKFVQGAGFSNTKLDEPRGNLYSTSNNEAELLKRLYNGTLLNAEHSKYLIDIMKQQVLRSGIPAGSSGAPVADKVGNLGTTNDDMAIVYSPKATYVLVIMTDGASVANIRELSQQIYNYYNP